ncbi:hypothetical protein QFC21_001730 [Naganishia friedmannii]|uniref:Uncharacterized protein n=1 Tax=Naganishia friedmannii TaxID=89922 RepID=A0ACC2W2S4_9TREE|nr:hypothetical protein QFC21_001730 [Naganishia friedmannii]
MPDERLDRLYGPATTTTMQRAGPDTYPQSPHQSANDVPEHIPTGAPLNTHGLLDDCDIDLFDTQPKQSSLRTENPGAFLPLPFQSNRYVERPSVASYTAHRTTVHDSDCNVTAEGDLERRKALSRNINSHINNNNLTNDRPDLSLLDQSNRVSQSQPTQLYASISSTSTGGHSEEHTRTAITAQHHSATTKQTKSSGDPHTARNDTIKSTTSATAYPPASDLIVRTKQRRYTKLQNQQLQDTHFFINGRLMTGGDRVWPLLGSIVLLLGLGGLWLGTTGVWIWRDGLGGGGAGRGGKAAVVIFGYLLGVCFGAMMATAFRDPGELLKVINEPKPITQSVKRAGILPRNLDITYPIAQTSSGEYEPATRQIRVRNGTISAKYCETCKLYRPPRSSHCRLVLALIYTLVFSALHYSVLCSREHISFGKALGRVPEAAVSFILGVILLAPITALLGYHLRLMLINATTVEQIRASASKSFLSPTERPINHFTYGSFIKNFGYMICRPQNPSWLDASGWDTQDMRQPNPGVIRAVDQHILQS